MKKKLIMFAIALTALAILLFIGCQQKKPKRLLLSLRKKQKSIFQHQSTHRQWTRSFLDGCGNLRLCIQMCRWIDKLSTSPNLLSPQNGNIEQTKVKNR